VILPKAGKFDAATFWKDAVKYKATYYTAVPTIHLMLLARAEEDYPKEDPPPLRFIRSCSAPLAPATLEKLERTFGVPVLEAYAMSECNQMCASPLPRRGIRKAGTVGPSSGFIEVCILNVDNQEVPLGVRGTLGFYCSIILLYRFSLIINLFAGEICVRGPSVTKGYQNNEKANEEAFAGGWFHTGDEGVKDLDGYITVTGRIKERINRGGEKISPNEVDNALMSSKYVAEAVSFGAPDELYGQVVACAVRLSKEGNSEFGENQLAITAAIRKHVGECLSEFKVPSYVFITDNIPKNATGKIQRRHVARHFLDGMKKAGTLPAISSGQDSSEIIRNIWLDILECSPEDDSSDFFVMGGNSVRAMQGVSRLREYTGLDVSATFIIQYRTFGVLVEKLDFLRGSGAGSQHNALSSLLYARDLPRFDGVETSRNQEHMLLLYEQDPLRTDYLVIEANWLSGEVNIEALRKAYDILVSRHESLRTIFKTHGTSLQQIVLRDCTPSWTYHDLTTEAQEFEKAIDLVRIEMNTPFNLYKEPQISAHYILCTDEEHLFFIKTHHICFDGWSRGVMVQELSMVYRAISQGEAPEMPKVQIQYADYSAWQRSPEFVDSMKGSAEFWKATLEGAPPLLEIPKDFPRPSIPSGAGSSVPIVVAPSIMENIRTVSKLAETTPFVFLSTCFQLLLGRLANESDIVIGTPSAGRDATLLEPLIGYLVSPIPLRLQLEQPTFLQLLKKASEAAALARENNRIPLQDIIVAAGVERTTSYSPLYQNMFVLQDKKFKSEFEFPNIQVERLKEETYLETAMFDLTLELIEMHEGSLTGSLKFSVDLYTHDTANQFVACYLKLLESAIENPHRDPLSIALMPQDLKQRILTSFSISDDSSMVASETLAYDAFNEMAKKFPENQCLQDCATGDILTYNQTLLRSAGIASMLNSLGIAACDVVGTLMKRSNALCVSMLGIMKSGAAVAVLDSSLPEERLAFMIEISEMKAIIADRDLITPSLKHIFSMRKTRIISDVVWEDIEKSGKEGDRVEKLPRCKPSDVCFLNFTSGSTGKPKGATITHASAVNFVDVSIESLDVGVDDAILIKSAISFDAFPGEVLLNFCAGTLGLVLQPEAQHDVLKILEPLSRTTRRVFIYGLVPSVATVLLADPAVKGISNIAGALCGGEVVSPSLVDSLQTTFPGITLINAYGPCETGNFVTANVGAQCSHSVCPIGRPIKNANIYLCDEHLSLVPIGVPGEICISGPCVGNGYIGAPELTSEKFVPNPFSNDPGHKILYRSGDLAKWNRDRNLEFVGRKDSMVKLRGLRIELAEIECVIGSIQEIEEVAVVIQKDPTGKESLVAYISPAGQDNLTILSVLRSLLPSYMVPSLIFQMESLPKLVSGKVNRKELPAPDWESAQSGVYVEPSSILERELQKLWQEVLGLSPVSVEDDFFLVGGSSLLAMTLTSKMRNQFELDIPGSHIFQFRTIRQMAQAMSLIPMAISEYVDPLEGIEIDYGDVLPVSLQEELYCTLNQVNGNSTAESLLFSHHIKGQIDIDALQQAIDTICQRHAALRTRFFSKDGMICKKILAPEDYACIIKEVDVPRNGKVMQASRQRSLRTNSMVQSRQSLLRIGGKSLINGQSATDNNLSSRKILSTISRFNGSSFQGMNVLDESSRRNTSQSMRSLMESKSRSLINAIQAVELSPEETPEEAELWQQYSQMAKLPVNIVQAIYQEASRPFKLLGGNLMRVSLFRISTEEHVLLINMQHAISDGWTFGVVYTELNQFYKAAKEGKTDLGGILPPPVIQYPQFAVRQRNMYTSGGFEKGIQFWRQELSGSQEEISLPFDRERPKLSSYQGHTVQVVITSSAVSNLNLIAKKAGSTLTTVALAIWRLALHGLSGADDFCIGWAMGNRDESLSQTVGCVSNLAAIRTKIDLTSSVEEAVKAEQSSVSRAMDWSNIPWLAVVNDAGKQWGNGPHPIFGARISILDMSGLAKGGLNLDGCECREFTRKAFMHTSKYNLELEMQITPEGDLVGTLEYSTDVFNRQKVVKIARKLENLFTTISQNPSMKVKDAAACMHI